MGIRERKRFVNMDEVKKRTHCAHCLKKGHWARECPDSDKPPAPRDRKPFGGAVSSNTETASSAGSLAGVTFVQSSASADAPFFTGGQWHKSRQSSVGPSSRARVVACFLQAGFIR